MVTRAAAITGGGGVPYVTHSGIRDDRLFFSSFLSSCLYVEMALLRLGVVGGEPLMEQPSGDAHRGLIPFWPDSAPGGEAEQSDSQT